MCSFSNRLMDSTRAYAVYAAAGLRNLTGQTALPSEWILFLVRAAAFWEK